MSLQNPGALRLRWTDALLDNLDQGDTRCLALLDHLAHPDRQRAIERRIIAADSDATALSLAHSLAERGMTPSSRAIERVLSVNHGMLARALRACQAYGPDVQEYVARLPAEDARRLLLFDAHAARPLTQAHREWVYERALATRFEYGGQRDSWLIVSTLDFETSQETFDADLDSDSLSSLPDLPESRAWLKTQPALVERALAQLSAPHWLFAEQPVAERERAVADALASDHAPTFGRAIPSLLRLPNAARLCDEALASESVRHRRLTLSGARIRFDPPCDFAGLERDGIFSAFVGSLGGGSTNPSGSEAFTLWALDQDVYFRDAFISRAERGHSLRAEDIAKAAAGDELLQTALLGLQAKDSPDAAAKLEVRARNAGHVVLRAEALRALRNADPKRASQVAIERITSDLEEVEVYAPFMTEAAVCLTPDNAAGLDGEACVAALIQAFIEAPSSDAAQIIGMAIQSWFGEGLKSCGRPWTRYWRPS
ncbi:MAG: hypothetical protein AB8H86_30130 [Polyangiales bacterium]